MTHPAVDFVLSAIADNWAAGSFGDIPLERIDRDNSKQFNTNIRSMTEDLKDSNYVAAAYTEKDTVPIGTEYDLQVDGLAVQVRVVGLHESEFGYVDPTATIPPSSAGDPVPFNDADGLVAEIKDTIHAEKTFPNTSSDIDYTDLVINNTPGPLSYEYGDLYDYIFDVVFAGYEEL